ncbi:hypothetical protein MegaChil _gp1088 [Megavirus chiliensis]|nr:hypothetical protein MegaChil _gp1088 [Megavirus chiliensis]
MFDYYTGDDYLEDTCYPNPRTIISYDTNEKFDNHHKPFDLEDTCYPNPRTIISYDTNEKFDNHHKPFDIIDSLEDYFYTLFDELSELVQ